MQQARPQSRFSQTSAVLMYRWKQASEDPLAFLEHFVWTIDQHDEERPIKPFPAHRPHIQVLVDLWRTNRLLAIVKSRQMLCTWLFVALSLWETMFHHGRLIMLQSKRLDDAVGDEVAGDGLLGRAKVILANLPRPMVATLGVQTKYDRITFRARNSALWAIPQGADIIRQRTCSGILSDEAAFQEEFEHAYTAAMPTIRGGGWFVALSSAHPGFFQKLIEDTVDEEALDEAA